jgi:hypothetical protein
MREAVERAYRFILTDPSPTMDKSWLNKLKEVAKLLDSQRRQSNYGG